MFKCDRKVAVLLATYNGEKYLAEQLQSLINQEFKNFRCYIHDDGSKDKTNDIIEFYEKRYPEVFTICRYSKTGGAKYNFMSLLQNVEADIYALCDQDDVWLPDKLSKAIKSLNESTEKCEDLFLAFSDLIVTDDQLNVISNSFLHSNQVNYNTVTFSNAIIRGICPGCVMLFSKGIRDIALNYNNLNNIFMHDWWIFALSVGCDAHIYFIEQPTMYYRQHNNNTLGYHKRSILNFVKGLRPKNVSNYLKEKKAWAIRPCLLARELLSNEYLSESSRLLCEQIIQVQQRSKFSKVLFYVKKFRGTPNLILRLLFI